MFFFLNSVNSTNHMNSDLFNSYVILNQIQLRFSALQPQSEQSNQNSCDFHVTLPHSDKITIEALDLISSVSINWNGYSLLDHKTNMLN